MNCKSFIGAMCLFVGLVMQPAAAARNVETMEPTAEQLGSQLNVGDVVFIHVPYLPFEKISSATQSWANHVGIVIDASGREPIIAESRFPLSTTTTLSRFTARSKRGQIAVARLNEPLTNDQRRAVWNASQERLGKLYDTGFDLKSRRQFCSRFVHEVLAEATGIEVGHIESFASLFVTNPSADMRFWRFWYFGNIPWERQTITPASLLRSDRLHLVFDGHVQTSPPADLVPPQIDVAI